MLMTLTRALILSLLYPGRLGFTSGLPGHDSPSFPNESKAGASHCCTALDDAGLSPKLTYPGEDAYEDSVDSYWSLLTRLRPNCILQPRSSLDVSDAVKALVTANQTKPCHFAIRSGGHATWPSSNIQNGVTIDMKYMSGTAYNPRDSTASIGPGATWADVYRTLDEQDVAVGGGRAGDVGVGGLILGGGNSFYAAREGFVCDNVVNFEIVLASGDIVNANHQEHSDLFRALKGGSNNFGVVTGFTLHAWPRQDLWGGVMVYPDSTAEQQISAFVNFTDRIHEDPYASAINFWQYSSETQATIVLNVLDYTKPEAEPEAFKEYLAIPDLIASTMRFTNITDLVEELEQPSGLRWTFRTLTWRNDARVMTKMRDVHHELTRKLADSRSEWKMGTMIQPMPLIFFQHGVEKGGNALGLDQATENLVLFHFHLGWHDKDDNELFEGAADYVVEQIGEYARSIGQDHPYVYLAYAHKNQDPLRSYGSQNVKMLKEVANSYDPKGVFQEMVPGGFKIFDVETDDGLAHPGSLHLEL